MTESVAVDHGAAVEDTLRIADTCLILGQRLGEWCGHAPVLEEDIALANMALDLIGQTRALLTHVGHAQGLDEDQLAFLRDERDYRNLTMVELPRGDFAFTTLRNLFVASWLKAQWQRLLDGDDAELAGIAGKAIKEARYHHQHAADWVVRLGDGTEESQRRTRAAMHALWRYVPEMFTGDWADLQATWRAEVDAVLKEAGLKVPADSPFRSRGIDGVHTEHMGRLLPEMQHLQRSFPGGRW